MSKHFMAAVLVSLGYLGVSGCSVGADGDVAGETVRSISEAFSVETCDAPDAYHLVGETWSHHAIFSDKVDLLDTNDPAQHIYNAYNYDYSEGECELAFATDVTARPSGNPAMTARITIKQGEVTGPMDDTRCGRIFLQYAIYGQKFNRDGVWHHLDNNVFRGEFANGRCTLPNRRFGKIDWKDGITGLGKVGGLRYVAVAGEGNTVYKTCLALDPDDQGDHLNSLCPNITL